MRVLLTAFEPYDPWLENSSWEVLVELLRQNGAMSNVTTRRYPIDLQTLNDKLEADLNKGFDIVLHLGQLPGASQIQFEAIGLNVAGHTSQENRAHGPLVADGPVAYRTALPVDYWATKIREEGIPACVSYNAGIYLCNALLYLSHHWFAKRKQAGQVCFVHLPLTVDQTLATPSIASLKKNDMVKALQIILNHLPRRPLI